jgi:hypothetical protein
MTQQGNEGFGVGVRTGGARQDAFYGQCLIILIFVVAGKLHFEGNKLCT